MGFIMSAHREAREVERRALHRRDEERLGRLVARGDREVAWEVEEAEEWGVVSRGRRSGAWLAEEEWEEEAEERSA